MILGVDPLLEGHFDLGVLAIVLGKVVITFVLLLVSVLFMIWFERKVHADMSNRLGPNRAGPFGVLQTLADGIKFFFKEDLLPDRAELLERHRRQLSRTSPGPARGAAGGWPGAVAGSMVKSSFAASRTARSIRTGSSL